MNTTIKSLLVFIFVSNAYSFSWFKSSITDEEMQMVKKCNHLVGLRGELNSKRMVKAKFDVLKEAFEYNMSPICADNVDGRSKNGITWCNRRQAELYCLATVLEPSLTYETYCDHPLFKQ